jgi:hypothetical protein
MVEMALVTPVLALLVFGVLDFARLTYAYVSIVNAAREGARYCALHPGDSAGTLARVQGEIGGKVTLDTSGLTCPALATGQDVTVTVVSPFQPLTPLIRSAVGTRLLLRAPATMEVW